MSIYKIIFFLYIFFIILVDIFCKKRYNVDRREYLERRIIWIIGMK